MDALYGLAGTLASFLDASPGLIVSFVGLALVSIPLTLLHELGHATVARRLLGGDVSITVGSSGTFAELQFGRISVALNALSDPSRRGGQARFDTSHASGRDIAAVALGGPAASLGGFVATAWAYSVTGGGVLHTLLWCATLAGAGATIINLIPMQLQERAGEPPVRTDGALALEALRVTRDRRSLTPVAPTRGDEALRGRRGTALGVEPLPRASRSDDGDLLAQRARRLAANRDRSTPPPRAG